MRKNLILALALLSLVGCGDASDSLSDSSPSSSLESNTIWPYMVSGEVDIVESGFDDSDYASWAIGTVSFDGVDILIEFDKPVLERAGIDSYFNFDNPTTLMIGAPKEQYGDLVYPVVEIK